MSIKNLIEIASWDVLPNSRAELVDLAGLPDDFVLRPLPQFPSPHEVRLLIGSPTAQFSSEVTDEWPHLHKKIKHLPRIVQQAILGAWGSSATLPQEITEGLPSWVQTTYYEWSDAEYLSEVQRVKAAHRTIQKILTGL